MKSEALVSNEIENASGYAGVFLYRNNSGACEDETGRQIRYGLGNISAKYNAEIKSSDWIGITPLFIEPRHVGMLLGVFTAVETKASDWKFRDSDEHAVAQLKFINIVRQAGGFAGFAQSKEDLMRIIGR